MFDTFTQYKLFWITVQENSTERIPFYYTKHSTFLFGIIIEKRLKIFVNLAKRVM